MLQADETSGELSVHGCELLAGDADWNASVWDLAEVGRAELAEVLAEVLSAVDDPATVEALWAGDRATAVRRITRESLLGVISGNQLRSRTTYVIDAPSSI